MNRKTPDISFLLLTAMFVIVGIFSWRMYFKVYRKADTVSIHEFPKTINGWVSDEILITDKEKAILETDNVFVRRYIHGADDKEVYLFIVYSQSNRKVSHPPEICYTGSGATILSSVHDSFPSRQPGGKMNVNCLTVEKGNVDQVFFYWFKVGDSFTPNYWKQQGLIAIKSFLGQPSSSALIRISADIKGNDADTAIAHLKEFGQLIEPYLSQHLP